MTEPSTPDRAQLRAADADRDRVADTLGHALASGQLSPEEHAERLDAVYKAKTLGELVPLTEDLQAHGTSHPVPAPTPSAVEISNQAGERPRPAIYVFGGTEKKGRWTVPQDMRVVCVFGGASYDMRQAVFSARTVTVTVACVFGGISITVPDGVRVIDETTNVLGGSSACEDDPSLDNAIDPPTLILRGACVFGGVSVDRKPRPQSLPR